MINHILKASLERNRIISIVYQKENKITQRNIKVLKIEEGSVKAFCFLRSQQRSFKIDNILSASFKTSLFFTDHPVNEVGKVTVDGRVS